MRVVALCPSERGVVSGNLVTLQRIKKGIEGRGVQFDVVPVAPGMTIEDARTLVRDLRPDVLHFYHAYKTGRLLPGLSEFPAVVTLSGTDLNLDWGDSERRPVLERALDGAKRLVTYNPSIGEAVKQAIPRVTPKLAVIPKGVDAGEEPYDLRATAGIEPDAFLFFLPGGIRPVKNNLFAAEGLESFVRAGRKVRLVYAGPILDRFYGKMLRQRLQESPWVRHLESVPHEAMLSAMRGADVVLNTSQAEGISNALLEAMYAGRPVLASDIPGNRDVIEDGRTGVLYHRSNFEAKAERLLTDAGWRESLGRAAGEHARLAFSVDREIDALLETYRGL